MCIALPFLGRWARVSLALFCCSAPPALAQITLGTADSFGVLGGSTVTNTGASVVNGNLGVSPGSAITGFPPGVVVNGVIHAADAVALQAQSDTTIAFNQLDGSACNVDLSGQDLGGLTLVPGVYCYGSSAQLTGNLTLDAQGSANPLFIFKFGSALTTASNSGVNFINGGNSCNVFWQTNSSATIGTNSSMIGSFLALTSITLDTGASVAGRLLARNAAVTLDGNLVSPCGPSGSCPTITVNPVSLPNAIIGSSYSQLIMGSGGVAPYTFTLSSGALPNGLGLNAMSGVISGTPSMLGSFSFTISVSDANGCIGSRPYTIEILPQGACPVLELSPTVLAAPVANAAYNQLLIASGGTAPYTYSISTGALPGGLSLGSNTGLISGIPLLPGSFSFSVTATDANACAISQAYNGAVLGVCPTITISPTVLAPPIVGLPYNQQVLATGGIAPYTYAVSSGSLPNGLTLSSATGLISGVVQSVGQSNFTITASDANACPGSRPYVLSARGASVTALPAMSLTVQLLLLLLVVGAASVLRPRD